MVRVKDKDNSSSSSVDAKIEFVPTFWDEFEEVFELPSKELQNLIEDVDSIRKAGSIVKDFTCGKYGDAVTLTPIFCEINNESRELIGSLLAQYAVLLPPPSTLIQLNITQKQKLVNMDVNSLKAFSSGDVQHIWEEIKTLYSRSTTSSCKKAHTKEISTVDSDSESQQNVLKINDTHRTGRTKDSTVNKYDDTIPLSASPDITDMDSAEYSNNAASRRDTKSKEMFALLTKWKHVLSYPQIPKLVEPNSSSMQALKSSTTAVRGRPSGPLLDINGKNGTRLGRRGRHYSEVWQEEDYLEPLSASTQKFQPLSDWGQLLRNYSDNHDGYYREWLLQTYRGKLEVLRTSKSFKKRRKSDSRMRDSRVLHEDEQRDTLKLLPPPVPISVQHPASWGIGSRVACDQADYSIVHPASASTTVVYPPGYYIKQQHSLHVLNRDIAKNEKKEKVHSLGNGNQEDQMEEDVDVFNAYAEVLQDRLHEQELFNSVRLLRLRHVVEMDRRIRVVRARRQAVEQVFTHAFISSAPKNSDREMYRMKFCMKSTNGSFHNSGAMDTLSSLNALQPPPPSSSSSTTGDNLNRSVVSASTNRGRSFLGALVCSQIKYGCSLRTVKDGFVLEFANDEIGVSKKWSPAVVTRIQQDGNVLRHVKVCPLKLDKNRRWHMQLRESCWLKVEDGLASPLGVHTDALKHIRSEVSAIAQQKTAHVFGEWKYDLRSHQIVANSCESAESVYCEFCCSNATTNEHDSSKLSIIEVSPQIETEEHGHSQEVVAKEEKLVQQQQPEEGKQAQQQQQQQQDKPPVEVSKKIRIERSKGGIHLKAVPREEVQHTANNISSADPMSGRKQRDLMEVIREQTEMLPPEEVEQIHRQLTLPSVPHKHHPSNQHSSYQVPHQYDKQSPTSTKMFDSSNIGKKNKSPSYTIPPMKPYFTRDGDGSCSSSGNDIASGRFSSSSSSSSSSSGNGKGIVSNSNVHLGRNLPYPFSTTDSRHNMPAFQNFEISIQSNNYQSTDLAGDGSFFPNTASRQQF